VVGGKLLLAFISEKAKCFGAKRTGDRRAGLAHARHHQDQAESQEAKIVNDMPMIPREQFERNLPKVVQWVAQMEQACSEIGQALLPQNRQDAETIGVREIGAVKVVVLNEMPTPQDSELRELAEQTNLISPATEGMTFGHGIVLKAGFITRNLIAHELVHVLQYERFGGIEPFLAAYMPEVAFPPFYPKGPLEQEAIRIADIVCRTSSEE
jgi:hypothetical protein